MSQKKTAELNLFQINTTAYDEEDFLLLTSLTEEQIKTIVAPIVRLEREEEIEYDNDILVESLKKAYPRAVVEMYTPNSIDLISF